MANIRIMEDVVFGRSRGAALQYAVALLVKIASCWLVGGCC